MTDWKELESHVFFQTGKRVPIVIESGDGSWVTDVDGKRYLDFVAGIAVNSIGHRNPVLVNAIREQADKLIHISNVYYSVPQLQLAELLIRHSCMDRVYFVNSGAEANEGAIKLVRKWGRERKKGAFEIISTTNSFHGRTLAAVTATGTERYKAPFGPLPPGFIIVPFDDIEAIKQATTPLTCAIMLEPLQGEGGVNVPSAEYLRQVRQWCDEQQLLLLLDEVQTGIGRTGTLFAYEHSGVEPDVMTLAKGLAGGVPIGALLAKDAVASVFGPGDHGSTFGGNPLATAAGYAVLKFVIEQDLPSQVTSKGERLMTKLRGLEDRHGMISEVRGMGLLCAVQFDGDVADQVTRGCLEGGLLVNQLKSNVIRLSPSLTVSEEELDQAVEILDGVLTQVSAGVK